MRLIELHSLPAEPLSHDANIAKRVILRNGTVPHLTQLAQVRIPPGAHLTPHAHQDMHEIFIVLSGHGRVRCDGSVNGVAPGTCIQIEPNAVHAFENTGEDELVVVYFGIAD